jgi:hypothetical protein
VYLKGLFFDSKSVFLEYRLEAFETPQCNSRSDKIVLMSFPIKTCVVCGEEFELKPDKPGFANRCPSCSEPEADEADDKEHRSAEERKSEAEANAERRKAIRDLLYRKDR